jgi:putative FmdB family regulatory protein
MAIAFRSLSAVLEICPILSILPPQPGVSSWPELHIMSQYLYHSQDCDKEFTQSLHISDVEKTEIKCPNCGGKRVHQLVAAFSAVTAKKS